jgi:hypothetical protein
VNSVEAYSPQGHGHAEPSRSNAEGLTTKYRKSDKMGSIPLPMNLSKKELDHALVGLALGDGYYERGRISCCHTNRQRFYVQFLESFANRHGVRSSSRYDFWKNTNYGRMQYSTVVLWVGDRGRFEKFNRLFDDDGQKRASTYLLERITPLGLLFWYLDDGQLHVSFKGYKANRFAYLNIQGFADADQDRIQSMFQHRFGITTNFHWNNGKRRLHFPATSFRKFYDLVRPWLEVIPKEFGYKFNMQYRPTRLSNSEEFTRLYNFQRLAME